MISKFDFMNDNFPQLASYGQHAEQYIDTDIFSCQVNTGQIGETIVNLIFSYAGIPRPDETINAKERIDLLESKGCFKPEEVCDILHELRLARNDALHNDNCYTKDTLNSLLSKAVFLCEWFLENYAGWTPLHSVTSLNPLGEHLENIRIQKVQQPEPETAPSEPATPAAATPVAEDELKIPKQVTAPITVPDAVIDAITSARTGTMIPAPHALRNILTEMSFSPRISQWIRKNIQTGTVSEQSYRKLQILYRNRTMY